MIELFIDTSDSLITRVALEIDTKKFEAQYSREKSGDQNVLELISTLLKEHALTLDDLDSIRVKTGPGSFTGLRVGVSIANALSFALGMPVNSKKIGEIEIPEY